jgi:hypothetical protein
MVDDRTDKIMSALSDYVFDTIEHGKINPRKRKKLDKILFPFENVSEPDLRSPKEIKVKMTSRRGE